MGVCTSVAQKDVERRLIQHRRGNVHSTKSRLPVELIYQEEYADIYEAFRKERFYKTPKGKKELKETLRDRLTVGQMTLNHLI